MTEESFWQWLRKEALAYAETRGSESSVLQSPPLDTEASEPFLKMSEGNFNSRRLKRPQRQDGEALRGPL